MSAFVPINPRPFLLDLVNKDVIVRLKWNEAEYKGRLVVCSPPPPPLRLPPKHDADLSVFLCQSIDSYMNVQLSNTEEFIDQKPTGTLGQVLIRCNNVLWITAAGEGKTGDRDLKMED